MSIPGPTQRDISSAFAHFFRNDFLNDVVALPPFSVGCRDRLGSDPATFRYNFIRVGGGMTLRFSVFIIVAIAGVAHAEVSIDADAGLIKGLTTRIHFDAKAELLYSDTEVLQTKVVFNDILVDCQSVDGGAICADPVTGGYGFRNDDDNYIHEDFYDAGKDAYFEPNLIKWLPADYGEPFVEAVTAVLNAQAERRAFAGWRLYRNNDFVALAMRLQAEKVTPSLWRIGKPQFGISELTRPRDYDQFDSNSQANFPKVLPAESLRSRIKTHCGLSPAWLSSENTVLREQLRAFLTARLDHRQQFVANMNARTAARSSAGTPINWQRTPIESAWTQFVDGLTEWYVLVQENEGQASALAVVNFRTVGTTMQLDWITASLRTATRTQVEGEPGWSFGSAAYGNYGDPQNLYRVAYSNVCTEAQQ